MPSTNSKFYIGLMSGTSLDGIDGVIALFEDHACSIQQARIDPYPDFVRDELSTIIHQPGLIDIDRLGTMGVHLARLNAETVAKLLEAAGLDATDIQAIGCHGQTVRHSPTGDQPFSMQLLNPGALAAATNIAVVNDFRSADIALGGEGAPLASGFHQWLFQSADEIRAAVNIGGIANVTLLAANRDTLGFDTGPGNTLLDSWIKRHHGKPYDAAGKWAASVDAHNGLLQHLLRDPYFQKAAPKSTGREYFNADWLDAQLATFGETLDPAVVQSTLAQLTAHSIADSLRESDVGTAAVCGGGAHNENLMQRLQQLLPEVRLTTTDHWGLDPDLVEAAAFAWLAHARLNNLSGNVPSVTGARKSAVLGSLHLPPPGT